MKPYIHAHNSVTKFGGVIEDYLPIHNMMDSSKAHFADPRHRIVFHSTFGCYIIEQIFGVTITNSVGDIVQVRDIAEQHILEDLGKIPSLQDWLSEMNLKQWMSRFPIEEETTNPDIDVPGFPEGFKPMRPKKGRDNDDGGFPWDNGNRVMD